MTKAKRTAAITERALIQRIRRKLAHDNESLCIPRSEDARKELGNFYIADNHTGNIIAWKCDDLEKLGRELEVLKAWEVLA